MGYSKTLIVCFFTFALLIHSSQGQDSHQDYLDAHNEARKQVGVGPMTWDDKLEAYAQNYANQRIGDCKMQHSHGPYGENLAAGYPQLHAAGAVRMWVNEKQWYDYNSNTCVSGKVCGHYTQVVWRKSIRLGCARVKCNNGWYFITCNYDPPGNYVGQRPYGDLDGQPTFDSKLELLNDVY